MVFQMESSSSQIEFDINDKYLRLKKRSINKLINLPPKYLGNVNKGIEETILKSNEEICKEFNGIPIKMERKVLLQNTGTCIDDYPYIQFHVYLECIVFCPKVNQKVKAVVNKIGDTYVNCLICGRINATVFKRVNVKKDEQEDNEEDVNCAYKQQALNNLNAGQEILIKITNIKYEQNSVFLIATYHSTLS